MRRTAHTLLVTTALWLVLSAAGPWLPQASEHAARRGASEAPERVEVRRNTFDDGTLRTQWQVRIGAEGGPVRHGGLLRYHPNGQLALQGHYRDGRPTGVWRWFDERGRLLRSAAPQGDYDEIISGLELEELNTVYRDGNGRRLAEGVHKYGKPHGEWTYFHRGEAVRARGRFINGLPDGRWTYLYASGQVERLEDYKLGIADGVVMRGWPNGQERLLGQVEHGLRVGLWRTWHRNGQVESEGEFREDRREGEWRYWDVLGRLVRHVRFRGDEVVAELPLPSAQVARPRIVTDPELLPFRPRLYDESGDEIKLEER